MSKETKLSATHEAILPIGDLNLNVAVLNDGTRVITQSAIFKAFGRTKRGRGKQDLRVLNRPAFIDAKNLQPFINEDLEEVLKLIEYEDKNNKKAVAYNALILPKLCKVYLDARAYKDAETGKKALTKQQEPLARASEILLLGLSNIGIISLIDEVTGYQYERERFELQKILAAYVSDEILKWQLTFTDDFYKEIFRLWQLPYTPKYIRNKPSFIGKLTTKYVYEELPKGVLEKIKANTPKTEKGNWKYRFHQSLKPEVGREHLKKQIIEVTTLMSIAQSKEQFQALFQQKYGKTVQLELEFNETPAKQIVDGFDKKLKKALDYNPKNEKA